MEKFQKFIQFKAGTNMDIFVHDNLGSNIKETHQNIFRIIKI